MKGDFSRNTFNKEKHYSGVRMQQGRVQLDADWNEQVDIQNHRDQTGDQNVIGSSGASKLRAGFEITPNGDTVAISPGEYFVDGILCENESGQNYEDQPHFHGKSLPDPATQSGHYLFYLDVWQRHVTQANDESIREVALRGADTATRTQIIWQVKFLGPLSELLQGDPCGQNFPNDEGFKNSSDGLVPEERTARIRVQIDLEQAAGDSPLTGFDGLQNQLYRIEIHDGGDVGSATFKWSRDNGTVAARITDIKDNDSITISEPSKDATQSFTPGDWIEITDAAHELGGVEGAIVRLKSVIDGTELVFDAATATKDITDAEFSDQPVVRRWDQKEKAVLDTVANTPIALENGIEIEFEAGDKYNNGDYWLVPARTETRQLDWPLDENNAPALQDRFGIKHHYARLGILKLGSDGSWMEPNDCRKTYYPLADRLNLFYVSGDGQETLPGEKLAETLRVGVTNGQKKVAGAPIKFKITKGTGFLENILGNQADELLVFTGSGLPGDLPLGVAEISFELDDETDNQQVKATLLGPDLEEEIHLPVFFNGNLSQASTISHSVRPCPDTKPSITTVHSLFCEALKDEVNPPEFDQWPDLDGDTFVTVKDILNTFLFHLNAYRLPFKDRSEPSPFPSDLETVGDALGFLVKTQQSNLFYLSGDGQEALPGQKLPNALQVGVSNGQIKIPGAPIRFKIIKGSGVLENFEGNRASELIVFTGDGLGELPLGVSEVSFELDDETANQQIQATLLDPVSEEIHLPIVFNANLSQASTVSFTVPTCPEGKPDIPTIHSLFCEELKNEENPPEFEQWPDLDGDTFVTVKDLLNTFLFHLNAHRLPFTDKRQPSQFPSDLETVGEALSYVSRSLLPAGMMMPYGGKAPIEGWLECKGQIIARDEHQDLYDAILGDAPDTGTVIIPDLTGAFVQASPGNQTVPLMFYIKT